MTIKWGVLGLVFLAIGGVSAYQFAGAAPTQPTLENILFFPLTAKPVSLDPDDAAARSVGKATYVAGWVLTAKNDGFGGFSGLIVDAPANRLLAINDKGDWWSSVFDALALTPPTKNAIFEYASGSHGASKTALDAESIVVHKGGVLVSFEQQHRLEWLSIPGQVAEPSAFMRNVPFDGISDNGGMEAIAFLSDGRLLAFAERGLDQEGRLKAWLSTETETQQLFFLPPDNFAPTDAATLPNGDVLLLLRHYSVVDGVAAKVHHIRSSDIRPGAVLIGTEVLHLTPQMSVDNMEGLDVVALDDNTVRLVMISDDNFNPLQRTLLTMFDYKYR